MCECMADIQSATAQIRRGKRRKNKLQDKNIMSASATQGDHNKMMIMVTTSNRLCSERDLVIGWLTEVNVFLDASLMCEVIVQRAMLPVLVVVVKVLLFCG